MRDLIFILWWMFLYYIFASDISPLRRTKWWKKCEVEQDYKIEEVKGSNEAL